LSGLNITLDQLRGLIGIHVLYNNIRYRVIEVLEDRPSVVLQADGDKTIIQGDQHGNPTRRVPETITIPVLSSDKQGLSAEFLLLDLADPVE